MNVYPNVDFEPSAPVLTDKECEQIYKYNPELSNQDKLKCVKDTLKENQEIIDNNSNKNIEPMIKDVIKKELTKIYKKHKEATSSNRITEEKFSIRGYDDLLKVEEFGLHLGVNTRKYQSLVPLVIDAINAPLPPDWEEIVDEDNNVFFYNKTLKTSHWEHPMDDYYRKIILLEKQKYKINSICSIQ